MTSIASRQTTPAPIGTTDYGSHTTSWDPADGGTATIEVRRPNDLALLGGLAVGGLGGFGVVKYGKHAAARTSAAVAAAGAGADDVARAAMRSRVGWGVAAGAVLMGGLLGGGIVADQLAPSTSTFTKQMSREEYVNATPDDPDGQTKMTSGRTVGMTYAGTVAGAVAGGLASFSLLRSAPKPIAAIGVPLLFTAGAIGGMFGGKSLADAIGA